MDANTASMITVAASAAGSFLAGFLSRAKMPSHAQLTAMIKDAAASALREHETTCMVRASLREPAVTPAYGIPLDPRLRKG